MSFSTYLWTWYQYGYLSVFGATVHCLREGSAKTVIMNQKIEKFQNKKDFSPHYTLEISLSCRNCGTFKERWMAASDGPTAFPFILTMCEYCGCFRFDAILHAKFFDNRDEKNLELAHSKFDYELRADAEADKRLIGPKVIKNVEGERLSEPRSS